MTPAERARDRLLAWADTLEPRLRRAVLLAWQQAAVSAALPDLVAAIQRGDLDEAVRVLFDSPNAQAAALGVRNAYAAAVQSLRVNAGRVLVLQITTPVADARLLALVARWEDAAFKNIWQGARDGMRTQIAAELARGIGPRQAAIAIKTQVGRVGLTSYDEGLIASYRKALEDGRTREALGRTLRDRRYDRSLAKGALTPKQIDTMTDAYRRKLVALRAETFARTSALSAANDATTAAWEDAVAQGRVVLEHIRRYWIVAADERLCPICEPIPVNYPNGVGLREPFQTKVGAVMNPTLHPACRCTTYVRIERPGVPQGPQPGTTRMILPQVIPPTNTRTRA